MPPFPSRIYRPPFFFCGPTSHLHARCEEYGWISLGKPPFNPPPFPLCPIEVFLAPMLDASSFQTRANLRRCLVFFLERLALFAVVFSTFNQPPPLSPDKAVLWEPGVATKFSPSFPPVIPPPTMSSLQRGVRPFILIPLPSAKRPEFVHTSAIPPRTRWPWTNILFFRAFGPPPPLLFSFFAAGERPWFFLFSDLFSSLP